MSVIITLYYVAIIVHHRVCYHAFSLHYECIRCSGIIHVILQVTFVPNFVSFAASIAELAHGEKSRTQSFNDPAHLMPSEPKHLCIRKTITSPFVKCGLLKSLSSDAGCSELNFISNVQPAPTSAVYKCTVQLDVISTIWQHQCWSQWHHNQKLTGHMETATCSIIAKYSII